jgi:hypothetical protein
MRYPTAGACLRMSLVAAAASIPWLSYSQELKPEEVARKQQMQEMGAKYSSAWQLYQALQKDSKDAAPAKLPDWSGVWTRGKGGLQFDPDLPAKSLPSTAPLTPEGEARVQAKVKQISEKGGEYDPISDCRPPGVPRWFSEPFLKEFVPTANQTWLMNEMVNDVRRVYTDGRPHTPEGDAYPLWNGDTIGFWSGDTLVAHTNSLMSGQYQRGVQPDYSEKVELVERWRKVDDSHINVDLWVFDPVNLKQPWYTRQIYTRLTNADKSLRVRYWNCHENDNNQIMVKQDGTSQFKNFDFVKDNAAVSSDPAVKAANSVSAPPGTKPSAGK